jgi:ABC-type antimicrobial peptide transport system permease subunit
VLAAVGIYGVVAYVVSRRTREIGIRMALGATPGEVVALVVRQGIRPAILGVVLGLAGALGAGRLISGLLYGVEASDPVSMIAATVLLLLVVLAACGLPARRAAHIPPASALRAD